MKKYFSKNNELSRRGFTLIELLVVISIIALLSSIVLASLNSARVKARDTRRLADVNQLRLAIEFFVDSTGGSPPSSRANWRCLGHTASQTCWNGSYSGNDALNADLAPYIPKIPDDPRNNASCAGDAYLYNSTIAAGSRYPGAPAGAYIHWYTEQPDKCGAGVFAGTNSCGPYCELWVGTPVP